MVEMAVSASASLAARSLAAILPGAGSWRDGHSGAAVFGQLGGHAAGFDGAPHGGLARPVSSAALRSLKTVIATRPRRTSLGRR